MEREEDPLISFYAISLVTLALIIAMAGIWVNLQKEDTPARRIWSHVTFHIFEPSKPVATPESTIAKTETNENAAEIAIVSNDPWALANRTDVRVSHYWPPLGGTNCSQFRNGRCVSRTASGKRWEDFVGSGAACVKEWPFGTRFKLPDGSEWECVDRGGDIRTINGIPWVDLLTPNAIYPYGTVVEALVLFP